MKSRTPELISGRLKKEGIGEISVESIYKWIFNEKRYLIPYLRRYNKDRIYKKRGSYKIKVSKIIKGIIRITELKKEHIGQIQTYMNYIDMNIKSINQNKTIGIIICKKDNKFIMQYCSDKKILSREYELN